MLGAWEVRNKSDNAAIIACDHLLWFKIRQSRRSRAPGPRTLCCRMSVH